MNRTLIIAVLIAVLAGGYYFYSRGNTAGDMMDAASDAVSGAADTATGAADAVADTATGAADAVADTAAGAADAVADTAAGAADAVADTAAGAADAVADTAAGAAESASDAMDGALFSVDGYDAVKVADMIDASALDESQKSSLKTALMAAGDDPALLANILTQVKEALGM